MKVEEGGVAYAEHPDWGRPPPGFRNPNSPLPSSQWSGFCPLLSLTIFFESGVTAMEAMVLLRVGGWWRFEV